MFSVISSNLKYLLWTVILIFTLFVGYKYVAALTELANYKAQLETQQVENQQKSDIIDHMNKQLEHINEISKHMSIAKASEERQHTAILNRYKASDDESMSKSLVNILNEANNAVAQQENPPSDVP